MTRMSFTIRSDADRQSVADMVRTLKDGMRVDIKLAKRSDPQNAKMWACIGDVAAQVKWHGLQLSEDDWKLIFMNGLKRELRIVPNVDGTGFVSLGQSSSDLSVSEMSDMIELILAFGANHGVIFKEPESNSPEARPHRVEADTPAARPHGPPNPGRAAGVTSSEASLLSDDWRHTYFAALTRPGDRKDSLVMRHQQALQMLGGEPTAAEIAWMRLAWALVRDRNEQVFTPDEFMAEKTRLLQAPLPEAGEAA